MKKLKYTLTILLIFFVVSIISWKIYSDRRPVQVKKDTLAFKELEDTIGKFMKTQKIPGLAITVSQDGKIIWSQGFGYADIENEVLVNPSTTRFRIASLSKPLTSAALGILYEQRKLSFDDEIQKYVPYFPKKRYKVTVRQVAGHIGGIRHYNSEKREFLSTKRYFSVKSAISIFGNDPLIYKPGTRYKYSTYGWNLLSAVIEGAANTSFLDFMNNEVFCKLGMDHTIADFQDSIISGRTRFYSLTKDSIIVNAPYVDLSEKWAGGGFLSTTEDLVKFANSFLDTLFLTDSTRKQLLTSQHLINGKKTGYGMGWSIKKDKHGRNCFGHSGSGFGGRSVMTVYPKEKISIAIATNSTNVRFDGFEGDLVNYILDLDNHTSLRQQ